MSDPKPNPRPTPSATDGNRVSTGQKVAWGIGGVADTLMANTLNQLVMPIYNVGLGVDARLVGIALGALRLLDAFTDPFMGNLSDNTRSRWGRRRPYIFAGAILGAVLYAMIWMPPSSLGETGLFVYLLVVSTLFFVAYTIFSIPFGALVFEMTPDTHERTRIISCRTFFLGAALIAIPWL